MVALGDVRHPWLPSYTDGGTNLTTSTTSLISHVAGGMEDEPEGKGTRGVSPGRPGFQSWLHS